MPSFGHGREIVRENLRTLFVAIGIIIGCSPIAVMSQAQGTQSRCPVGYWLMESLCLNNSTGDVVYAAPSGPSSIVAVPGCRPGYWRLDSLCQSPSTGDIELVDEQRWPVGSTRAGR